MILMALWAIALACTMAGAASVAVAEARDQRATVRTDMTRNLPDPFAGRLSRILAKPDSEPAIPPSQRLVVAVSLP